MCIQAAVVRGISSSHSSLSDPVKDSEKAPATQFDHATGMEKCVPYLVHPSVERVLELLCSAVIQTFVNKHLDPSYLCVYRHALVYTPTLPQLPCTSTSMVQTMCACRCLP